MAAPAPPPFSRILTFALLAAALLAGCMSKGSGFGEDPSIEEARECPTYPDGSRMECDASVIQAVSVRAQPPTVDEGWACVLDHDDDAPDQLFRLYAHEDGRLGWHWRQPLPEGGVSYVTMGLYEPERTQWMIFPYESEGFVEYPEPAEGTVGEAEFTIKRFILHYSLGGEWHAAEGARLLVGILEETGYYVWDWDSPWGRVVIDVSMPSDEEWGESYRVVDRLVPVGDVLVSAGSTQVSVDFDGANFDWKRGLLTFDCFDEGLPAAGVFG